MTKYFLICLAAIGALIIKDLLTYNPQKTPGLH